MGLCGRCLSVWGLESHIPALHNVYVYKEYLLTEGREEGGGGVELSQREGWGGNSLKRRVENTNMTEYISSL